MSATHGEQEQSAWNGHFGCTCFDGEQVLKPVVARYRGAVKGIAFRGDAAFAQPNMYEFLEAEGIDYAIRLPANQVLQERISDLLGVTSRNGIKSTLRHSAS